jgi:hypothetical protein
LRPEEGEAHVCVWLGLLASREDGREGVDDRAVALAGVDEALDAADDLLHVGDIVGNERAGGLKVSLSIF